MPHPPTNGSQPQSSDVYIAVMGVTGSGKSTFISKCTDQDVKIGHDLQSCTQGIGIYQSSLFSDKNVYLVDTPGFDDTSRTDKEVLKEIATWLGKAYTDNIRLSGIIYLHRITDTRMQGSAKKNLFMFNKLCGSGALKRVILATTMWGNLANEGIGVKREKELVETEEFWGWMTRHGSQIKRHHDTKESAKSLLQIFVSSSDTPMGKLKIQEEIVDRHKTLNQTSAGMELDSAMAQEREKFRKEIEEMKAEMKEAKAARDLEAAKSIEENRQEVLKKIKSLERDREDLKVSFEAMYKERFARLEEQFREMKLERERSVPSIATLASAQRGNFQRRHNYSRSGNYYGGNGSGNYYGGNGRENERDYQRPIVNQWKTCLTCNETFQSRNALFSHLKEREQAGRSNATIKDPLSIGGRRV
ncbi:P-loop containing nucleoside triphosphate hydrolase protein [Hypoxylon sp. NC1633]|nr:P-loop containing nucleoside triphosphate hydrolase protein [Hypoxylon sp. NC1633]